MHFSDPLVIRHSVFKKSFLNMVFFLFTLYFLCFSLNIFYWPVLSLILSSVVLLRSLLKDFSSDIFFISSISLTLSEKRDNFHLYAKILHYSCCPSCLSFKMLITVILKFLSGNSHIGALSRSRIFPLLVMTNIDCHCLC